MTMPMFGGEDRSYASKMSASFNYDRIRPPKSPAQKRLETAWRRSEIIITSLLVAKLFAVFGVLSVALPYSQEKKDLLKIENKELRSQTAKDDVDYCKKSSFSEKILVFGACIAALQQDTRHGTKITLDDIYELAFGGNKD